MNIRLFDGHCDTAFELWHRKEGIERNTCHIDLEKAASLGAYAQVFAFCSYAGLEDLPWTAEMMLTKPLALLRSEVAQHKDHVAFAQTGPEVDACLQAGKIAALLSVEGPEIIDCRPEGLERIYRDGFCMTTLTWNADNVLAGYHGSDQGLTDWGREFVATAQEFGIMIDVSHLGERSFWDLIRVTKGPILASHSNCRALWDHSRNLTDAQLQAVAETGGTVGLNLYPPFLGDGANFETLQRHLDHALHLCGETHVALGGDLDGCEDLADGFTDVGSYLDFYQYLLDRGYGEALLDRLFFSNLRTLFD